MYAHHPAIGMSQGNMDHTASFFFFVNRTEPVALTKAVPFKLCVSAETLKACALNGLHLLAAGDETGSSGSKSPALGDMWRYGCPKSRDVESGTESEGTSSSVQCQHNVESLALNVMEQDQSREKMFVFLEDWDLARVALSCHIALNRSCQECMRPGSWVAAAREACGHSKREPFLSLWMGCDSKGEGCGELF